MSSSACTQNRVNVVRPTQYQLAVMQDRRIPGLSRSERGGSAGTAAPASQTLSAPRPASPDRGTNTLITSQPQQVEC